MSCFEKLNPAIWSYYNRLAHYKAKIKEVIEFFFNPWCNVSFLVIKKKMTEKFEVKLHYPFGKLGLQFLLNFIEIAVEIVNCSSQKDSDSNITLQLNGCVVLRVVPIDFAIIQKRNGLKRKIWRHWVLLKVGFSYITQI